MMSCKKDEIKPDGYYPKVGDTYQSVVDNWGKTKNIMYLNPSFNDSADYYYKDHKTTIRVVTDRVVMVTLDGK